MSHPKMLETFPRLLDNPDMDTTIHYADATEAATMRSTALRWLLTEHVMNDGSVMRQFRLTAGALVAIRDGAPLLVDDERGAQIDRLAAAESLLLDGYTSSTMAAWFLSSLPSLKGKSPSDLLSGDVDATPLVLEAAAAWMA